MSDHDDEDTLRTARERAMMTKFNSRSVVGHSANIPDSARLDEIRRRIASRAYDHPAMLMELAHRILESGDL